MSAGIYQHRKRKVGETVDAPMYNTAHKNQVNNDVPPSAGRVGEGVALTDFRATLDPFPSGAAPQADLGSEMEQYRFVIADIKGALTGTPPTFWYSPITLGQSRVTAFGAQVQRIAFQAITGDGAGHPISFDTTEYDTGVGVTPFFSNAQPTRLTAPVAGLYYVVGYVSFNATGSSLWGAFIQKNGTGPSLGGVQRVQDGTVGAADLQVSTIIHLNANDYVELDANQATGAPQNATSLGFAIELLNPDAAIPPPPRVPGFLVIQNNAAFVINNTTVPFIALTNPQPSTNQNNTVRMQVRMPSGCILTAMQVKLSAALGGTTGGVAIRPIVNGIPFSAIEPSIAPGGTTGSATGSITILQDDFVFLEAVFTGDVTTASVQSITIGYTVPS